MARAGKVLGDSRGGFRWLEWNWSGMLNAAVTGACRLSADKEVVVNRLQWQQLAERWLVDAKILLDAHRWSAAYYLVGYAAECGLKACVLKRLAAEPEVVFNEKRF